ncbi:MAG: U3 snoRNP protein [Caeruleum heppii]|nr:MAG: U3 snoRNP protein [Caeruleum heppii]
MTAPPFDLQPASYSALAATLSASPHTFLQPPPSLHAAALVLAKRYLDPLAASVSQAQAHRLQLARRKRKRDGREIQNATGLLRLNAVYLEGFATDQVWEQARRVVDATKKEVETTLPAILSESKDSLDGHQMSQTRTAELDGMRMVRFDEDGFEISRSDEEDEDNDTLTPSDMEGTGSGEEYADEGDEDIEDEEVIRGEGEGQDDSEDESGSIANSHASNRYGSREGVAEKGGSTFIQDPNGLNDGFFSIDDFNKESEFLEQQDARGDPNDGAASDEEDIDWDTNPLHSLKQQAPSGVRELSDEDSEGDGPTFGNVDLNAPEGESDEDIDEDDMTGAAPNGRKDADNTNDIRYEDFFAPPPRPAGKGRRNKNRLRQSFLSEDFGAPMDEHQDNGLERTMQAVRRDLFEDELAADGATDDEPSQLDPADPRARRSTHERRKAKLAEEIRKLEAANVAKREWTLAGEARAGDRPLNSLLEEDLDFERTGKPVPVITAAISEDIEEMIKRRILAQEFDEVKRRRPDSLDALPGSRRGRFELDDSKPQQSLADIYEREHLEKVDPLGQRDVRDEKLQKEHREIEALWADISAKLDALSNWHYKPKPPKANINIVTDVPTIAMEDARPTTAVGGGADMGASSMLAPQEMYAPGKDVAAHGEVVPSSGVPLSKGELTREEKLRRRRREKKKLKKKLIRAPPTTGRQKREEEQREVVGALKRGQVKVIGKKGETRDVEGKKIKESGTQNRAGGVFKL